MIPDEEEFPYALRLVSEVLSSNGSTSMASVCASSLSLMDAGVPISDPVGGVAMGLIAQDGQFVTLTDIIGAEDALGDMDFKVAGTADVITALQLDTKIQGLPSQVLADALAQAKEARLRILEVMREAIPSPRTDLNQWAPRIEAIKIPKDKIGEVIGPKGKVIRELEEQTGATIEIEEEGAHGIVRIGSNNAESLNAARDRINLIVNPPEVEVGSTTRARWSTSPASAPSSTSCRAATGCCTSRSSTPSAVSTGSRTTSAWATRSRSPCARSTGTAR